MLTNITDRLDLQDRIRLAMANRFLRSIIPPPTHEQFLRAESGEWAISKGLYTCEGCVGFQRLVQFADDMRKGRRARRGLDAATRLCIKCGVDRGCYSEGMEIAVLGRRAVLGRYCRALTDQPNTRATCGSSGVLWTWTPKEMPSNEQHSEDDWEHSTRNFVEGKHTEELCGFWTDL
jgi:hypothetical protein